jgi:hypothetical protein
MEQITTLLTSLVDKTGIALEHFLAVLHTQAVIYAGTTITGLIGGLAVCLVLWNMSFKLAEVLAYLRSDIQEPYNSEEYAKEKHKRSLLAHFKEADDNGLGVALFLLALLATMLELFYFFYLFSSIVTALVNPDYWAITQAANLLNR